MNDRRRDVGRVSVKASGSARMLAGMSLLWFILLSQFVAAQAPTSEGAPPRGDGTLPKYKEMILPAGEDLLRAKPFDWVVLKTDEVLVVEPVSPRNDPVMRLNFRQKQAEVTYNRVLKFKTARLNEVEQQLALNRNLNGDELRGAVEAKLTAARDRVQEIRQSLLKLPITLLDDSIDPDYLLDSRHIQYVVHFEDLLLRRVEQLIVEGRLPLAYDLLLVVHRRHRDNNVRIVTELETEERSILADNNSLKTRRDEYRKERDQLKTKPATAATKKRLTDLENNIETIGRESKELDEELLSLRKKLRFARPKDFPRPDPPLKDDVLFPSWPGYDDAYSRLILKDAELHAIRDDFEGALRLLEEIWKPESSLAGLSAQLGNVIDRLIGAQVEKDDFRQARHFLNRLTTREPEHAIAQKWKSELTTKATAAIVEARAAATRGEADSAVATVERAARIWPDAPGLKEAHRELTDKFQSLRVGVLQLPGTAARSPFVTEADDRARLLTMATLFEPSRIDDQGVRYRSPFFEAWEPTDLGRQVRFALKLNPAEWESRPVITAADVYAEFATRLDSASPAYDERLAGFVSGIAVHSPSDFTVQFRRLPLRVESLLQFTVGVPSSSQSSSQESASEEISAASGRTRWTNVARDERQAVFRRLRPESVTTRHRHVAEVVEVRYDSWESALQGLLRGEVAMLPQAGLGDLKALQEDGRFFVVPYALPRSHFLMFQPTTVPLRDSQLRRALLHAIPRERLLSDLVLKDAPATHARVVTGPFASTSYGYNRLLEQPAYDPQLAAALGLAAKKRAGGNLLPLRLLCPPDPGLRETARALIENWKRVGLEVKLLDSDAAVADDGWDICYRTARMVEPIADLWPLLTLQSDARVAALQPLPERTRRVLLELERTIDWTSATRLLHRQLGDLITEARYVPLWEVDEFAVTRRHLVGLSARPMHAYDDVDRWTLQSWYPQETP